MVLMGIAGVGLILLVVQRVLDKELFAIGFIGKKSELFVGFTIN